MRKLFPILLALLLLGSCRVRTVGDPALADTVLPTATPSTTPTPTATPEPTPTPTPTPTLPPTATPEPSPTPEPSQAPVESTRPDRVTAVSATGPGLVEEAPATGVTVTYDPNGGDGPTLSAAVQPGQTYGPQPEATRRGHSFIGWWTQPTGGERVTADTIVTNELPHTLYAHWESREAATVTYDGNGGRVKSREAQQALSDGDPFGAMPTPLREGYTFEGWFTLPQEGEQITEETIFPGGEDLTLYAHWTYDPYAFWSFTLQNKTQQVYLCQQVPIYFETQTQNVTAQSCPLITATGSQNVAENREDPNVTDDWVNAKRPQVILKEVPSLSSADPQTLSSRFPEAKVVLVTPAGLGTGAAGLYARLALAKELYGDWYTDVDLSVVAQELGVSEIPIRF